MGDIVYWKDGREVYDSVNVIYRYSDGRKINYESLISNKYNGMEEQILGKDGTMDLSRGIYYLEEDNSIPGMSSTRSGQGFSHRYRPPVQAGGRNSNPSTIRTLSSMGRSA